MRATPARVAVHVVRLGPRSPIGRHARWLTPRERAEAASMPARRAVEWAAARLAAKESVRRLCHPPPDRADIEVERDGLGVPWALAEGRRIPLSLSHAGGWAAGAAHARLRVGVDVEPLRPLPDRLSRYFLAADERVALEGWGDRATASLAAWAVKEAVLKATGWGLSLPPTTVTIRSIAADGSAAVTAGGAAVAAACWREEGAVVAVACAGSATLPPVQVSRSGG